MKQITYSFGILTNECSGNFHRAMTTYITGCPDDSDCDSDAMENAWDADCTEEEMKMFRDFDFLDARSVDDYGLKNNYIYGTPCNNVEIFVLKDAIDEEGTRAWELLAKRAYQFLDLPFTKKRFPNLKILGFEIISYELKATHEKVHLG